MTAKREQLPGRRRSWTQKARVGGQSLYLGVGEYDDGRPGEVFLTMSKAGTALRGFMDALAITMSIALQHGVPLGELTRALRNIQFQPAGVVEGSEAVPKALSPVDYIARELEAAYVAPAAAQGVNGA